jgi:hypothetical protein
MRENRTWRPALGGEAAHDSVGLGAADFVNTRGTVTPGRVGDARGRGRRGARGRDGRAGSFGIFG